MYSREFMWFRWLVGFGLAIFCGGVLALFGQIGQVEILAVTMGFGGAYLVGFASAAWALQDQYEDEWREHECLPDEEPWW